MRVSRWAVVLLCLWAMPVWAQVGGDTPYSVPAPGAMLSNAANAVLPTARINLGAWPQISAVKDLGFVGDGVTDNSAKLATLFAYTTSPTVYFDPGTYMIGCPASTLYAQSNISIIGAGQWVTTLKFSSSCAIGTTNPFVWQALTVPTITGVGINLGHFTLDANAATRAGGITNIFTYQSLTDSNVADVGIVNTTTNTILLSLVAGSAGTSRIHIEDNYFAMLAKVNSAVVKAGGAGGTNGACTVTGTTGTGTKFQASGTVAGNTLGGALTIPVAGLYSAIPSNSIAEPVTGCGLTGATLTLTLSTTTQNQGVLISNSGAGDILDIWIAHNTFVNTAIDSDGHDVYIIDNDITGWGYGAGITVEASADSHDMTISRNDCHDSNLGLDSGAYAPGCIETWGAPDTVISANVCRNLMGSCVDNGSVRALVVGNRAYGIGKRYALDTGNTCAFVTRYIDGTYNGNGSRYIGNTATDDGSGNQRYGHCDTSASNTNIKHYSNDWASAAGAVKTPLGTLEYADWASQNTTNFTSLAPAHFYGANFDPSTSTPDAPEGIVRIESAATNTLDIGATSSSPFSVWMQARSNSVGATQYPLNLQPRGGGVAIGAFNITPPTNGLYLKGNLEMPGATSGTLDIKPAAIAGTGSTLTLPGGTTDFSATGGANQFVQQASAGAALTVGAIPANTVSNAILAQAATNTVKGNATSGTANETDLAVGSCSTSGSALIWTTNTGFGCNTAITATGAGPAPVACTGTCTLGTANRGTYTRLDTAGGSVATLPGATGSGSTYKLYVSVATTSNSHKVLTNPTSDTIIGTAIGENAGTAKVFVGNAGTFHSLQMPFAGSQPSGGFVGDTIVCTDVANTIWKCDINYQGGTTPTTPYSTSTT